MVATMKSVQFVILGANSRSVYIMQLFVINLCFHMGKYVVISGYFDFSINQPINQLINDGLLCFSVVLGL